MKRLRKRVGYARYAASPDATKTAGSARSARAERAIQHCSSHECEPHTYSELSAACWLRRQITSGSDGDSACSSSGTTRSAVRRRRCRSHLLTRGTDASTATGLSGSRSARVPFESATFAVRASEPVTGRRSTVCPCRSECTAAAPIDHLDQLNPGRSLVRPISARSPLGHHRSPTQLLTSIAASLLWPSSLMITSASRRHAA